MRWAEYAQRAGLRPQPLLPGKHGGVLRAGKPWAGLFVWSSHKTPVIVETYMNGKRNGVSVGYHSKSVKHWEGHYIEGRKDGIFRIWDPTGKLVETETWRKGVRVE
jgi:antitoxin component YwqK of YwqJK toxin-antitoxin module